MRRAAWLAGVALLASAASPAAAAARPPGSPLVWCSGEAFRWAALQGSPGAERARTEPAGALRSHLAGWGWRLPKRGWRVLRAREGRVLFGRHGRVRWSRKPEVVVVAVARGSDEVWRATRSSSCPKPLRVRGGAFAAPWRLNPSRRLSARTRVLHLLVDEPFCSSGQSPKGRIEKPLIRYSRRHVLVGMFVRPRGGGPDLPGKPPGSVHDPT